MKNKAAVLAMILTVLILQCSSLVSRVQFSKLPYFSNKMDLSSTTHQSNWLPLIQLNNVVLLLLTAFTIISLIIIFRKWENLKFYGGTIIKRLNIIGYLYLIEGFIALVLYFGTTNTSVSKTLHFNHVHINLFESSYILIVGLLFLLITTALGKAKLIKEENDLTI